MSKSNALSQAKSAIEIEQSNIAKSKVSGGRGVEFIISSSSVNGQVSYTTGAVRHDVTKRGAITYTGVDTDMAINDSSSMFVVKNETGKSTAFTRSGSFRVDQKNNLVDAMGNELQGWRLQNGNLPTNNSSFDSLQSIKIEQGASQPKATSKVTMSVNLNSNQDAIKGAGTTMKIGGTINKGLKENDIISPFSSGSGYNELKCGDNIKAIVAGDINKTYRFRFGGATYGHSINNANNGAGIFGATKPSQPFVFAADRTADPKALVPTDGIKINVGGKIFTFTAMNNGDTKQNQFHNLYTLRDVINNTGYLQANIKDGALCIGSVDANQNVTFENVNGGCIVEELGIANVPLNDPDVTEVERFNSLRTLQEAVKRSSEGNLVAEIDNGGINIRAAVATDGLQLECNPTVNKLVEALPTLGDGTVAGRATITLQSAGHGLKQGDYVWLENIGGTHENGMYMVTGAPTPNHFTVGVWTGGNFSGVDAKVNIGGPAIQTTWRKVPGVTETVAEIPVASNITVAVNGGSFVINMNGLAQHDLVYIQGLATAARPIPDGYYVVNAVGGGGPPRDVTFTKVGGGNIAGIAAGGVPMAAIGGTNQVTVRKVGLSNAGVLIANDINADRPVLSTTNGSKAVRINVEPGHNYQVGEKFNIIVSDVNPNITVDNMTIATGKAANYTITNTTVGYIQFEVPTSPNAANASTSFTFNSNMGGGAGACATLRLSFPDRTYSALGVDAGVINDLAATYDGSDADKSLSEQADSPVSNFTFPVVDLLGNEHTITMRTAHIGSGKWVYELVAPPGAIKGARADNVIKSGTIEFNPDGKVASLGNMDEMINIQWENGSNSSFTLDLDRDGKITQLAADSSVYSTEHDGATVGHLENVQIDSNGNVVFLYSNGKQDKVFRVALATFNNPNRLEEGSNGTFIITKDSGTATLRSAGEGGTGEIQSQAVEGSGVEDMTKSLIDIQAWNIYFQANAKILTQENEMQEYLIAQI